MSQPASIRSILEERIEQVLQSEYQTNEEFNSYLDSLDGDKLISEYVLSEVLYWVDRKAYYEEREVWLKQVLDEEHAEAIEIVNKYDTSPIFIDLTTAMSRRRIVPFIGAGMSQVQGSNGTSAFPMWIDALRAINERVPLDEQVKFDSLIRSKNLLEAAELLWDANPIAVKSYIRNTFDKSRIPSLDDTAGGIRLLPRFAHGCVITTNYDKVVELAYEDQKFDGYMHGSQKHKFTTKLIKGDRCILKLHGDVDDSETYILTESQYNEAYGETTDFTKPLPKALRQIFISHSILFLGCSLDVDRTIKLFQEVARDSDFDIPDHFAILSDPCDPELRRKKEDVLSTVNIRPIWYPNEEHKFVKQLLSLAVDVSERKITFPKL